MINRILGDYENEGNRLGPGIPSNSRHYLLGILIIAGDISFTLSFILFWGIHLW